MQNFINFSILKNFKSARTSTRALRIFYHLCQKTMIFEFSQRCEIRRAPRAEVRARQIFFWKCNLHDKISLQIFLFDHNLKREFFRLIWSLKFFLKIRFFSKFLRIWKFWKISEFFWIFHEKIQYSKASTAMNFKNIRILKTHRIYRIDQRISYWKNVWRAQVKYATIEVRAPKFKIVGFFFLW